mmetsp:Transcript_13793/g.36654  ORF Transcript_13793/g.36654 Transcript_13793/m.36654 type:complete len:201 (+) Transcript_13793:362-964(+)
MPPRQFGAFAELFATPAVPAGAARWGSSCYSCPCPCLRTLLRTCHLRTCHHLRTCCFRTSHLLRTCCFRNRRILLHILHILPCVSVRTCCFRTCCFRILPRRTLHRWSRTHRMRFLLFRMAKPPFPTDEVAAACLTFLQLRRWGLPPPPPHPPRARTRAQLTSVPARLDFPPLAWTSHVPKALQDTRLLLLNPHPHHPRW